MCNWHKQHKRGPTFVFVFVFVSVFVYLLSTNTNTLFTFEGTLETIVLPNLHKFSENLQTAFDPPPALVSENYVALFTEIHSFFLKYDDQITVYNSKYLQRLEMTPPPPKK